MKKLFAALTVCTCGFSAVANAHGWVLLMWTPQLTNGFHQAMIPDTLKATRGGCLEALGRVESDGSIGKNVQMTCVYVPDPQPE